MTTIFSASVLDLDPALACAEIQASIREQVLHKLHRRGVVLGLSGGVDSSVVASLCVRALGADRVFALLMPDQDSAPESLRLGKLVASKLDLGFAIEPITSILIAADCYRRRDEAIRAVIPEYGEGWKAKLVVRGTSGYSFSTIIAESPEGERHSARLSLHAYLGIVSATNFKQRARKMLEYYHADHLHYAVAGSPNRLEYDLGFFVKCGDGSADLKPIAHLYKRQVYQLAEWLEVPEEIRLRPPTTDTYSLAQSQEEFYFSLPLISMDLCLLGKDQEIPAAQVASAINMPVKDVEQIYANIDARRRMANYLHQAPLLVTPLLNIAIEQTAGSREVAQRIPREGTL